MLTTRLSGLLVAAFGAAMLALVIPAHTEAADYGWLRPQTLPSACAWALVALGLAQAALSGPAPALPAPRVMARAALALALAVAGLRAMAAWGFLPVAPILAAALMWLTGERRWPWYAVAVLAVPMVTWAIVAVLLGRGLP